MDKKQKIIAGSVAGVLVVALAGGGIAVALNNNAPETEKPQPVVAQKAEETKNIVFGAKDFKDADSSTSPLLYHIKGQTDTGEKVDFWHAQKIGEESIIKVKPGKYQVVDIVTPVNADGSIYKIDMTKPRDIVLQDDNKAKANTATVVTSPEKIEAEDVTAEELEEILAKVTEAVQKGDETLTGDKGKEIVDNIADNIAANPNADKDKVEDAAKEAEESVSDTAADSVPASTPASDSGSASAAIPQPAPEPSAPAHTHNWVEQTEQKWVPNIVWVEDSAAYDEPVYETQTYVLCSDGTQWPDTQTAVDYIISLGRGANVSYSVVAKTVQNGVIHHDATGHQEDQGHYETVITGYVCSGCGATK